MPMAQYAAAALNGAISTPREREVQRRVGRSILDRSGRSIEGAGSEAAWVAAAEKISAGIGAVICVVAIGKAGQTQVEQQLNNLGDTFV
jgi:hypothetical protein